MPLTSPRRPQRPAPPCARALAQERVPLRRPPGSLATSSASAPSRRVLVSLALSLALAIALTPAGRGAADEFRDGAPAPGQRSALPGQTRAPAPPTRSAYRLRSFARGLEHPWSLAWLPDGRMLVTERPGRLRLLSRSGRLSAPLAGAPRVSALSNGGLLDVAVDPHFAANRRIYLTFLEGRGHGANGMSVARARLSLRGSRPALVGTRVILRSQPAAADGVNVGARLAFGRDGRLYVSFGDRLTLRDQAQDLMSDLGKIARINPDGSIPADNPFVRTPGARKEIWSLGHRDPEGLALNPWTGELWEHEHGPKGGDEVNLIRPGRNYGWPVITYGLDYSGARIGVGTARPGLEQPLYYWDPSIAPSGMAFYDKALFKNWRGDLLVGALKAQRLLRLTVKDNRVVSEEVLATEPHQRIRDVRVGPDGAVYLLTDEDKGQVLRMTPS